LRAEAAERSAVRPADADVLVLRAEAARYQTGARLADRPGRLRARQSLQRPKIFVTAASVRTDRAKIFAQPQLSPDTIMASACLSFMFEALQIDGEAYRDGDDIGSSALHLLVDHICRKSTRRSSILPNLQ